MRIFVAGIATETNTFSPIPTGLSHFSVSRSLADPATVSCGGVEAIAKACAADGHELIHGLLAFAEPSGLTTRPAYECLRDDLLEQLRAAGPVDVVILLMHGAMVADGYEDCEFDQTSKVREIVGPDVVIGVELDLHAHLDQRLLDVADLVITYKEYPHVDINDRALELYRLCLKTKRGEVMPTMALHNCRMVGLYSTFREPVRGFVDAMTKLEQRPEVLSVSFCHGFPWGDVPHCGSKMLVVTDKQPELARSLAREMGQQIFELRDAARLLSIGMEEALSAAVKSEVHPVVVADQSDNAGGGAPSDSTFVLRWLLDHAVRDVGIAFMYDPEVVKIAFAAGQEARLKVRLGGKTSEASGDPVDLTVRVHALSRDYQHEFPQQDGPAIFVPAGDAAVLECAGIYLVCNSHRTQCFSVKAFSDFGLGDLKIYVPKSTNHFMSGFGQIAARVFHMAAPGAIPPVMQQIPYQHFDPRGYWPWTEEVSPE